VRQWKQNLPHISSPFKYERLETKASKPYITGNEIASIVWLLSPPDPLNRVPSGCSTGVECLPHGMFTPPAPLNRVPSGCSTGVECEAYSSGAKPIALGPSALRPSPITIAQIMINTQHSGKKRLTMGLRLTYFTYVYPGLSGPVCQN
jgi:hypothetical protein